MNQTLLCATLFGAALAAPACASQRDAQPALARSPVGTTWRSMVTDADTERLSKWRQAWTRGLAEARASGAGGSIAAEGILLDPDAALALQEPPPGGYRCRTIKMGSRSEGQLDYVPYPWFDCRLTRERGLLRLVKLTGSQRPVGTLLPQTDMRMVFLGTLQLGDETNTLAYARDRERDLAGLLERIGERRWRLVFPYPRFESLIDIIELVPKEAAAQ